MLSIAESAFKIEFEGDLVHVQHKRFGEFRNIGCNICVIGYTYQRMLR